MHPTLLAAHASPGFAFLALLFLLGCGAAAKSGWDHAKSERGKSRSERVKEAGKKFPDGALPKSRHKAVAAKHSAGWWTRELLGGFPVTRTGVHAGWLAHSTEAEHQKALRDEARTHHLQTRADYQPSRADHKRRQQELRDQILLRSGPKASRSAVQQAAAAVKDDIRTAPAPTDVLSRHLADSHGDEEGLTNQAPDEIAPLATSSRADARPGDSWWLREGERRCPQCGGSGSDANGGTCAWCRGWGSDDPDPDAPEAPAGSICSACGRPGTDDDPVLRDGPHDTHRSHALEAAANHPEPRPRLRTTTTTTPAPPTGGTTVSETTFTTVIESAKGSAAAAEGSLANIKGQREKYERMADEMQAMDVDNGNLSLVMDIIAGYQKAEEALAGLQDTAGALPDSLKRDHGQMEEAVTSSPVPVAQRQFYGEGQ